MANRVAKKLFEFQKVHVRTTDAKVPTIKVNDKGHVDKRGLAGYHLLHQDKHTHKSKTVTKDTHGHNTKTRNVFAGLAIPLSAAFEPYKHHAGTIQTTAHVTSSYELEGNPLMEDGPVAAGGAGVNCGNVISPGPAKVGDVDHMVIDPAKQKKKRVFKRLMESRRRVIKDATPPPFHKTKRTANKSGRRGRRMVEGKLYEFAADNQIHDPNYENPEWAKMPKIKGPTPPPAPQFVSVAPLQGVKASVGRVLNRQGELQSPEVAMR